MISLNEQLAGKFLEKSGLRNFEIKKVAGDASFRSYYRIFTAEEKFILMFAPPSHEEIKPFIAIDELLTNNGFSAPKIFNVDHENGFILLEDLGDDTYGRVLASAPDEELALYEKACDCLAELHEIALPKNVKPYNTAALFREVMLFVDWYVPAQNKRMTLAEKAEFKRLWFALFDLMSKENQVLVLRDFHADNLMILPSRNGFKQVGLLDFQDALIGSKAYDLVSLLEDARRDVDVKNREKLFGYFVRRSGCDVKSFTTDYEILSLQRNMKILGIFCRLALRDGKNHYLQLIPRVLDFVKSRASSSNPIFLEIGEFLRKFL
jgi:aminoglycoside/choline kinase family phosphotransferase